MLEKTTIIPRTPGDCQSQEWRRELARAVRDPAELLKRLDLPATLLAGATEAAERFPLRVPPAYLQRIRPGDPRDPLLRQVLPLGEECREAPGFLADPVGDLDAVCAPGLLQKYRGRALLLTSPACAVHCRYCFRREFPYVGQGSGRAARQAAVAALSGLGEVRELILSGGDPLSLDDAALGELVEALEGVPSLKTLRFHTRLPVVVPSRVTSRLVETIGRSRLRGVVVIHCNHPREVDGAVREALRALGEVSTLLNQSVLLAGVNDDVDVLESLSLELFDAGVLPYYLHCLDRVRGTAHFEVPRRRAQQLMVALRDRLPGYLVPRLVEELPGGASKIPVA